MRARALKDINRTARIADLSVKLGESAFTQKQAVIRPSRDIPLHLLSCKHAFSQACTVEHAKLYKKNNFELPFNVFFWLILFDTALKEADKENAQDVFITSRAPVGYRDRSQRGEKQEIQLECYPTQPWIQTLDVSAEKGRTRVIDWVWPDVFTLENVIQNIWYI